MTKIASWLGGIAFVAALIGGAYLAVCSSCAAKEKAKWQQKLLVAEREARQTEADLRGIIDESGRKTAERERAANEKARKQDQYWRATLARVPPCPVPRDVGVQLDTASGVSAATAVAEPPRTPAADAAFVDLAETLDTVRSNYETCRVNIGRLSEARDWYTTQRLRINGSLK